MDPRFYSLAELWTLERAAALRREAVAERLARSVPRRHPVRARTGAMLVRLGQRLAAEQRPAHRPVPAKS